MYANSIVEQPKERPILVEEMKWLKEKQIAQPSTWKIFEFGNGINNWWTHSYACTKTNSIFGLIVGASIAGWEIYTKNY